MSSMDPITMATQLATYDVLPFENRYKLQSQNYQNKLDAWNALESALEDFESAIDDLSSSDSSLLKNKTQLSEEGYLSAEADSQAIAGSYEFFVKQLASSHQFSADMPKNLTSETAVPSTGEMTLSMGSESFTIDLATIDSDGDGVSTIQELTQAINGDENNPGINASLVRSSGKTHFVVSGEETGWANSVSVSTLNVPPSESWFNDAFDPSKVKILSRPQNAIVELGGENGLEIKSASNTFENMLDGVDVTVTKVHQSGDSATKLTVEADQDATKTEIDEFISAYNTLIDTVDKYTSSGGEDSERAVLAGDASARSIERQLRSVLQTEFSGTRLSDLGITSSREGKLELDSDKFNAFYATSADKIDQLFTGKNQLLDSLDEKIAPFLKSNSGVFANRKDTLEASIDRNDQKLEALDRKYQMSYDRYLKQFTQMNTLMNQMNQTMSMFG